MSLVMDNVADTLQAHIRTVLDYPQKGIAFRDITPLLGHAEAFSLAIEAMAKPFEGVRVDKVAGIEARGFILGGAIAHKLHAGFIPIRKAGKLPYRTIETSYALEYGEDRLEVHKDAVKPHETVLLVDDLIATGGTALAAIRLMRELGADVVGASFLIDLTFPGGKAMLENMGISAYSVIFYSAK